MFFFITTVKQHKGAAILVGFFSGTAALDQHHLVGLSYYLLPLQVFMLYAIHPQCLYRQYLTTLTSQAEGGKFSHCSPVSCQSQ